MPGRKSTHSVPPVPYDDVVREVGVAWTKAVPRSTLKHWRRKTVGVPAHKVLALGLPHLLAPAPVPTQEPEKMDPALRTAHERVAHLHEMRSRSEKGEENWQLVEMLLRRLTEEDDARAPKR